MADPCGTITIPAVHADLCVPEVNFGGLSMMMFTRRGDGLTLVTDATEWGTRLDNASAVPPVSGLADIRQVFGIGGVAAPERNQVKYSRGRSIYTTPKFSNVFRVDDTGDTNWDFLRDIPVEGMAVSLWVATETRIFGGNDGIDAVIYGDPNIPESDEEIMTIDLTWTFEGTIPEVADNPL